MLLNLVDQISKFPCEFIHNLDWEFLSICENIETPLKAIGPQIVSEGLFIVKKHNKTPEILWKHLNKVIFFKLVQKVPTLTRPNPTPENEKPETIDMQKLFESFYTYVSKLSKLQTPDFSISFISIPIKS